MPAAAPPTEPRCECSVPPLMDLVVDFISGNLSHQSACSAALVAELLLPTTSKLYAACIESLAQDFEAVLRDHREQLSEVSVGIMCDVLTHPALGVSERLVFEAVASWAHYGDEAPNGPPTPPPFGRRRWCSDENEMMHEPADGSGGYDETLPSPAYMSAAEPMQLSETPPSLGSLSMQSTAAPAIHQQVAAAAGWQVAAPTAVAGRRPPGDIARVLQLIRFPLMNDTELSVGFLVSYFMLYIIKRIAKFLLCGRTYEHEYQT